MASSAARAQKRLILYDLDGTLVDTAEDMAQAVNVALTRLGCAPLSSRRIRAGVGQGLANLIEECLGAADAARVEAGVQLFRDYYGAHLVERSALYPGAREVLEHFRDRTQAVVTNKPDPFAHDLLEALGVAGYFSQIVTGEAAYPMKPDPTSVAALMTHHCVHPGETLLIGDSPIDIETGRRAGVLTVVVSHGFSEEAELRSARPDALVPDFHALLALARRQGW